MIIAAASHASSLLSQSTTRSRLTATVKKPTSRRNGPRETLKGLMMHMEPTTHDVMNVAAPSSSPIARPPEFVRMAENVANMSGEPLPNARKVTPATFSSRPRIWAMVARFGVKKSEALMPRVEKRKTSQRTRPAKAAGRRGSAVQK